MSGRRTSLTPEVQGAICAAIEQGIPLKHAAAGAGIHEQTLQKWVRLGNADLEANPDAETPHAVFALEVARARAAKVSKYTALLALSSSTPHASTGMLDPRGAMFILERTEQRDYTSRSTVEAEVTYKTNDGKAEIEAMIAKITGEAKK